MDDTWSYEMDITLAYYEPYDAWYPQKQVKLLLLYDELGLPHAKNKQVFGHSLEIIGLLVDPIKMTISMSEPSCNDLVTAIRAFINMSKSRRWPLIEWQRILGWINWGLNAYPLVRPALQPAYAKISGKQISRAQLYLNRMVIHHFLWLAETIESSDGIHMLDSMEWVQTDADLIIYSDTSLSGLGFTAPNMLIGFCTSVPNDSITPTIFFSEALAITSAVLWPSGLEPRIKRLLIYTDSLNCVNMFNTLSAK